MAETSNTFAPDQRERAIRHWIQINYPAPVSYDEAAEFVDVFFATRGLKSFDEYLEQREQVK